jgi:hypothetical protein
MGPIMLVQSVIEFDIDQGQVHSVTYHPSLRIMRTWNGLQ